MANNCASVLFITISILVITMHQLETKQKF